jgi:hypothetical protein
MKSNPYRVPSYPDKDPVVNQQPTFKEIFSKKWKSFCERTKHIRSEKWTIMFFTFCGVYTLLASFLFVLVSRQYFLKGQWGLGIAYIIIVVLYFATSVGVGVATVKIAQNK